jgi:hypothetical protein
LLAGFHAVAYRLAEGWVGCSVCFGSRRAWSGCAPAVMRRLGGARVNRVPRVTIVATVSRASISCACSRRSAAPSKPGEARAPAVALGAIASASSSASTTVASSL